MFNRIHRKLGTAGFVISIVALVAALGGGAYAASGGLNGKQKKEVEKIAKKYAGKPGATGPAGAAGAKGDAGAAGASGTAGVAGNNGVSVTTSAASGSECEFGGVKLTSAGGNSKVCNGEEGAPGAPGKQGEPWTDGGTLPAGSTETGQFTLQSQSGEPIRGFYAIAAISFPIPLAQELDGAHALFVEKNELIPAQCENSNHAGSASVTNPEATEGFLCVFEGEFFSMNSQEAEVVKGATGSFTGGTTVAGADVVAEPTAAPAIMEGTWAVTGATPAP
jgi:hypothetical protein